MGLDCEGFGGKKVQNCKHYKHSFIQIASSVWNLQTEANVLRVLAIPSRVQTLEMTIH